MGWQVVVGVVGGVARCEARNLVSERSERRGRNPSLRLSMLGCWPEAASARTGFAAASYLGDSVSLRAHFARLRRPACVAIERSP